ncbi:MAG TPA: hypothetical protein VHZ64_08515, partial [Xanthobacteraceae bacterium]|nr:hypothetical protein [Xanthobacteraceae bacterium]
ASRLTPVSQKSPLKQGRYQKMPDEVAENTTQREYRPIASFPLAAELALGNPGRATKAILERQWGPESRIRWYLATVRTRTTYCGRRSLLWTLIVRKKRSGLPKVF